jgi:hypothetical protein
MTDKSVLGENEMGWKTPGTKPQEMCRENFFHGSSHKKG